MDDVLAGLAAQLRSAATVERESTPEHQWVINWKDGDVYVLTITDNTVIITDRKTGQILTTDDHTGKDHRPLDCVHMWLGDLVARGLATLEGPYIEPKTHPASPWAGPQVGQAGMIGIVVDGETGQAEVVSGGNDLPPEVREALRRLLGM